MDYPLWAVVDLMGHSRLAGLVREETIAGATFLRIDVPRTSDEPDATLYQSPQSIYCLRPATEQVVRLLAERWRPEPLAEWDLPDDLRRKLASFTAQRPEDVPATRRRPRWDDADAAYLDEDRDADTDAPPFC